MIWDITTNGYLYEQMFWNDINFILQVCDKNTIYILGSVYTLFKVYIYKCI